MLDHMVIGEDEAVFVDDETGAERSLLFFAFFGDAPQTQKILHAVDLVGQHGRGADIDDAGKDMLHEIRKVKDRWGRSLSERNGQGYGYYEEDERKGDTHHRAVLIPREAGCKGHGSHSINAAVESRRDAESQLAFHPE